MTHQPYDESMVAKNGESQSAITDLNGCSSNNDAAMTVNECRANSPNLLTSCDFCGKEVNVNTTDDWNACKECQ